MNFWGADLSVQDWVFFVLGLLSAGVWVASVLAVWRSPKFLQKVLWTFLSFFSFRYSWGADEGTTWAISVPLGAFYVLWFWQYGPSPTTDQIEFRRAYMARNTASRFHVNLVRSGYFVAMLMVIAIGVISVMPQYRDPHLARLFSLAVGQFKWFAVGLFVIYASVVLMLAFLSCRPYWWGKVLGLWAAFSWIGFALISFATDRERISLLSALVLMSGLEILLVTFAHQWVDPRFGGSYLRSA